MRSEPNLPARQGHKRVETAGVYPLAPRRGARQLPPAEVQRKTPPPVQANRLRTSCPRTIGAEKNCRPDRTNTLTQFAYPGQPVLSKTKEAHSREPLPQIVSNCTYFAFTAPSLIKSQFFLR